MPSGPLVASRHIVNTVLATAPTRIVDLGMGTGKYGFLLREQFDFASGRIDRDRWELRIDGVEGYAGYVGDHQRSIYDEIVVADVVDFLSECPEDSYDFALALDIIEHFPPAAGITFMRRALQVAESVFVSTPKAFYPQDDAANELEVHRSWWPSKALKDLARVCEVQVSLAQLRMVNLAVLSRAKEAPSIKTERLFEVASVLKDRVAPEVLYYRAIKKAGPSILDLRP